MSAPTLVLLLPVLPQLHDVCRLVHTFTIMRARYPAGQGRWSRNRQALDPHARGIGSAVAMSSSGGAPKIAREETMAGDEGPFPGILSSLAAISAAVRHLSWGKNGFIQAGG